MSKVIRSYLNYARGKNKYSPWNLLYPLQYLTRFWMILRIAFFERGIFSVTDPVLPVISIGNVSMGGTNKTPMTELVVKMFLDAGLEAGLVSRGYKAANSHPIWVGQDSDSLKRKISGDEPLMLSKRIPGAKIVVSKDRLAGVKLLADLGAEIAVTDDTFQHRKMNRDVDIVLVDATCPFGNGNVIPAGVMREPMEAFSRADILVITRANQVTSEKIEEIRNTLSQYVDRDKIFVAEIAIESWLKIYNGERTIVDKEEVLACNFVAFSAIGNPKGFYSHMGDNGIDIICTRSYIDHYIFKTADMKNLDKTAIEKKANAFICTEKDTFNLPDKLHMSYPIYVPRIKLEISDLIGFTRAISDKLKPEILVASNGYGEDAIGVILADKLRNRFKAANVNAYVCVGSGKHYRNNGINVISPICDMPSGGIVKYSIKDFIKDIRYGLGGSIMEQLRTLRGGIGKYRTPICVGDVYLLMHMLLGQGMSPLLVATAKTVHLHGHLKIEKWLLRHRSRMVWTRDIETAESLKEAGVNVVFKGNPIMDLAEDTTDGGFLWNEDSTYKILLLPGSRPRAYDDVKMILKTAEKLASMLKSQFVLALAPTIDITKLVQSAKGWVYKQDTQILYNKYVKIKVYEGGVVPPAREADLLIGLGGTANQLCAGFGVPVISIIEKGKLRQKKLLREAEILVEATPERLAETAMYVLTNEDVYRHMSESGLANLGVTGASDSVVEYCADVLGWDARCKVYEKFKEYLDRKQ